MEYSIDHIDIDAPGMGDDYIALAAVELRKRHPAAVVVSGRPVAAGDIWNAEKGSYDKYLTVELKWTATA